LLVERQTYFQSNAMIAELVHMVVCASKSA
jgi:hypothetical protein